MGVGEGHGVKVCYDLRLRTSSSCKAVAVKRYLVVLYSALEVRLNLLLLFLSQYHINEVSPSFIESQSEILRQRSSHQGTYVYGNSSMCCVVPFDVSIVELLNQVI